MHDQDGLLRAHWSTDEKHPAVLALLEMWAPGPDDYPVSAEEWPEIKASFETLPSDRRYVALNADADYDSYEKFVDRHLESAVLDPEGSPPEANGWAYARYDLVDGRVCLMQVANDPGGGGSEVYVVELPPE